MNKPIVDFKIIKTLVLNNKKLFAATSCASFVVALVIAFSIPKEYTSTVVLAPEASEGGLSGNLGSLASMVGAKLGNMSNSDAVYPQIYPEICASDDFIIPLWSLKVQSQDGSLSTTLYDYVLKHRKTAWWNKIKQLMLLPFAPKSQAGAPIKQTKKTEAIQLTQEQENATNAIKGMLKCVVDKKTDMITITTKAQDPLIAATVADYVQRALQTYIIKYRTTKARNDLSYTEKLYSEAKVDYDKSRQRYGSYSDANTDIILQSYKLKQTDLENEMQLKYNIYSQLAQQLQLARAKVQERTPAFTIIQSAVVPLKKASPRRGLIVGIILLLNFLGTLQWTYLKNKGAFKKQEDTPNPATEQEV